VPEIETPNIVVEWTVQPDAARYRRLLRLLFGPDPSPAQEDESSDNA
jgi:hypothetical protein